MPTPACYMLYGWLLSHQFTVDAGVPPTRRPTCAPGDPLDAEDLPSRDSTYPPASFRAVLDGTLTC